MTGDLRRVQVRGDDKRAHGIGDADGSRELTGLAGLLEGVALLGDGTVSDMIWARPAVTVIGIDAPPVISSASAINPRAARLTLRIPPGMDPEKAQAALRAHLLAAAPGGVHAEVTLEAAGAPFRAKVDGPAYRAIATAMEEAYRVPMTTLGQGGSIPLCNVFADTFPHA